MDEIKWTCSINGDPVPTLDLKISLDEETPISVGIDTEWTEIRAELIQAAKKYDDG